MTRKNTGVKDINGKDIYEHDIVRCYDGYHYHIFAISWDEKEEKFLIPEFKMEIIGNTHDNPDVILE